MTIVMVLLLTEFMVMGFDALSVITTFTAMVSHPWPGILVT